MNCGEVRKVLHDYVDSNLNPETEREVDRHLGACESCEEHERKLRALIGEAAALPEWIDPPRDLWPTIEGRLDEVEKIEPVRFPVHRARVPLWGYGVLAASLLIAIIAGVYLGGPRTPVPELADEGTPDGLVEQARSEGSIREAEGELIRQKDEIRAAFEARRGALDPETAETVDRNLALIESAIGEIHVALEKEPTSPELNRMLMAAHQRELYLLQRAMQLAARL